MRGHWQGWEVFRKQREQEYRNASDPMPYHERLKTIGEEWKNHAKHGRDVPAVADVLRAEAARVDAPQPAVDQAAGEEEVRQEPPAAEPAEGGVPPAQSAGIPPAQPAGNEPAVEENEPAIEDNEGENAEGEVAGDENAEGGIYSRLRSHGQAHVLSTIMSAINTIGSAGDTITQGHFTPDCWDLLCAMASEIEDMPTLKEALNGPNAKKWRQAIHAELQSLLDLGVYEKTTRDKVPKGKKVLLSKLVLKYKAYEQRFKARLVALGFMQPDEDVGETFAPVAKFTTFRILMAVACYYDLEISSSDVKTAFLNAIMNDPIYMYPPRGLGFPPHEVWILRRALYGLKSSPHFWHITFHNFLMELGFEQSPIDPCLYYIEGLWILQWVDDSCKVGTREAIEWFERECEKRFTINHVRDVEMFVGIEIKRDRKQRTLELTQTANIEKMLRKFKLIDAEGQPEYGVATPMQENTKISKADCCNGDAKLTAELRDLGFDFISAAASCLYVSICTRPDIAFAAKEHCKVMSDPGPKHVPSLKRLMKYLRGTRHRGLRYTATGDFDLSFQSEYAEVPHELTVQAWCDASFGDDPDTRRSTQAMVSQLCGAAVGWFCQTQKSTSLSTAEAELIALADAIKEVKYIRETMKFLELEQKEPTIVFEDNMAVVSTAHNPGKNHGKLKHVAIRVRSVQENVLEFQVIDVVHCTTKNMIADILTKALGKEQYVRLAAALLGYCQLE